MKKRKLTALIAALMLVLTSCGGASKSYDAAPEAEPYVGGVGAAYDEMAVSEEAFEPEMTEAEVEKAVETEGAAQQIRDSKLIYRGELSIESQNFDGTDQWLRTTVEEMGGYFQSSELHSYGRTRNGYYIVRVPQDKYRALLDLCGTTEGCKVTYRNESVEDVGQQYFDLELRTSTLRTKIARLQELLSQAELLEDILQIESELYTAEYELEYYISEMNRYDNLIDYATVDITLSEVVVLTEEEEEGFFAKLAQEFRWGAENFVDGLEDLTYTVAYNFFDLLLIGAVIAVVVVLIRRRKKKSGKKLWQGLKKKKTSPEEAEDVSEKK